MQRDLLALGPHQMIHDMAGGRVSASVAEPLFVRVAHEHRRRVVYATVSARMWRQIDHIVGLLLVFFEIERVELLDHLVHHRIAVAATRRYVQLLALRCRHLTQAIRLCLLRVGLLKVVLVRKRQLVAVLARLGVLRTHEIVVYERQRLRVARSRVGRIRHAHLLHTPLLNMLLSQKKVLRFIQVN